MIILKEVFNMKRGKNMYVFCEYRKRIVSKVLGKRVCVGEENEGR